MRKLDRAKIAVIVWLVGLSAASSVFAQALTLANPLGVTTFPAVVTKITGFLVTIAIPLTAIMALVGGFQMITSAGNPEKFSAGRKTLMYAAIGFAVVVLAGGLVAIITNLLNPNS